MGETSAATEFWCRNCGWVGRFPLGLTIELVGRDADGNEVDVHIDPDKLEISCLRCGSMAKALPERPKPIVIAIAQAIREADLTRSDLAELQSALDDATPADALLRVQERVPAAVPVVREATKTGSGWLKALREVLYVFAALTGVSGVTVVDLIPGPDGPEPVSKPSRAIETTSQYSDADLRTIARMVAAEREKLRLREMQRRRKHDGRR